MARIIAVFRSISNLFKHILNKIKEYLEKELKQPEISRKSRQLQSFDAKNTN